MSSDKFHCTHGHCLTDCVLSTIDYDRSFPPGFCPHSGVAVCWQKCETTEKKPTLFDTITASMEVLAPKFVYNRVYMEHGGDLSYWVSSYFSTIIPGKSWEYETEAIAATVAKLKEV